MHICKCQKEYKKENSIIHHLHTIYLSVSSLYPLLIMKKEPKYDKAKEYTASPEWPS